MVCAAMFMTTIRDNYIDTNRHFKIIIIIINDKNTTKLLKLLNYNFLKINKIKNYNSYINYTKIHLKKCV